MKKLFLVLTLVVAVMLAGCAGNSNETKKSTSDSDTATTNDSATAAPTDDSGSAKNPTASGKKLVIGTMANALGLPVHQADIAGYFKDAGLDVDIEIFATGAPINEAMAAGDLNIAVSGMASVYGLATGMYSYVGDGCITSAGQSIYARADSEIAKAGNTNGIIGSTDTVKGCSILGPLSTTAHYQAIKYVESFGLTSNDFNMVSMEYAQAYQAFITGEGDLIATKPPYSSQLDADPKYVKVCDFNLISDSPIVDTIFAQNSVMKERADDVELFLECYYKACEDLVKDKDYRKDIAMHWYVEEGITYTDADMDSEIAQQTYHTFDTLLTDAYPFGKFMVDIGDFFVTQGMIDKEDYPNIEASINSSLVEKIKKRLGK